MKKVNVVYEYDFNEVDIILIPDFVEEKLNEYVQKFFNWLAQSTDSRFCKITKSGYIVHLCDTEGFLYWLNTFVIDSDQDKATMLLEKVPYNPGYKMADF